MALQYVRDQTKDICLIASKNNIYAQQFIHDYDMYQDVVATEISTTP